jgi:hypothetical protein
MTNKTGYTYKSLFDVSVFHGYYENGVCPYLVVYPTHYTQHLMNDLNLKLISTPTGFMVSYDETKRASLFNFLWVNGTWSCLSFMILSSTPYFNNLTDLPIQLLDKTLYMTNTLAHTGEGKIIVHPGPYEKGEGALKVVNEEVEVILPEKGTFYVAEILDVSGKVIVSRSSKDSKGVSSFYIRMSEFPEGKYTLRVKEEDKIIVTEETFVYIAMVEPVLGFVDIFFEDPLKKNPDFFPVHRNKIKRCSYLIRFCQRSTYWNYYLIFPNRQNVNSLFIKSADPEIEFDGPQTVDIGDGVTAYLFTSREHIPLKERSPFKFKLLERSIPGEDEEVVGRLPVASAIQVLPLADGSFSNVYVNV